MFNPTIKEVIVVATLLPKMIPILWSNVNKFALISAIVIIIRAELDWMMEVEINPVNKDDLKDDVNFFSFCLIESIDNFNKSLLKISIE